MAVQLFSVSVLLIMATFSLCTCFRYPCVKYIVGKRSAVCSVCGSADDVLVQCDRESCPGIYCQECCTNLNKVCAVCQDAVHPHDEFELIV